MNITTSNKKYNNCRLVEYIEEIVDPSENDKLIFSEGINKMIYMNDISSHILKTISSAILQNVEELNIEHIYNCIVENFEVADNSCEDIELDIEETIVSLIECGLIEVE